MAVPKRAGELNPVALEEALMIAGQGEDLRCQRRGTSWWNPFHIP